MKLTACSPDDNDDDRLSLEEAAALLQQLEATFLAPDPTSRDENV